MNRTRRISTVFVLVLSALTLYVASGGGGRCLATGLCDPPIITGASSTPSVLWPPNHELAPVTINYTTGAPGPSFCVPHCTLSVSSNEPVNGVGDGNTSPDWEVLDPHHVLLRAERSGVGSGRTYTIKIRCANEIGRASCRERV